MKKRIISAIIALIIVVPLFIIGRLPFFIGIGIVSLLAYKEIVTLKVAHQKLPDLMIALGAFALMALVYVRFGGYYLVTGISYQAICALLLVMLIPTIFYDEKKYSTTDALTMIGSILLLGIIFNSMILVYNMNKYYLLYLFLITALNDSFAMIIGSLIGKHKLIPKVSPNKTVEGSFFGLVIGSIIASLFFVYIIGAPINKIVLVGMTVILSIVGQIGDLVFSKIKRDNNIKDFSKIMPGHGGILDRLDSLAFVLLAFTIIIKFI